MNMLRTARTIALFALGLLVSACTGESTTEGSTPEVQSKELAQLSAGGGIAGFDFYADVNGLSTRVGSLVVTNGAFDAGAGYTDQMEYWRWEPTALADIESGATTHIDVDFVGTSTVYDPTLVAQFESGTSTWTAWDVNRLFNLSSLPTVEWNDPGAGEVLFTMEADAWAGVVGTITYYLMMDFGGGLGYPHMTWYVDFFDFVLWADSEAADSDSDSIYEVRLTDDSAMVQTPIGIGFELKTVK